MKMERRKKVAVVTWLSNGNFGTAIQLYALYTKINDLGYDCYFFNRYKIRKGFKSIFYRLGLGDVISKFKGRKSKTPRSFKIFNSLYRVINIYTESGYRRTMRSVDVFVTGSDQIWNTHHRYTPFYFLDFAGESKRIAYASSIGGSTIPSQYEDAIKGHLGKFAHIGLREKTGVRLIGELLGRDDIVQVVDPSFLLDGDGWRSLTENVKLMQNTPQKYLLCYFIGDRECYGEQVRAVQQRTNIQDVVIIPSCESPNFAVEGAQIYSDADPLAFVKLIDGAAMICTDSFHAMALSINHSKQFVAFKRFADDDERSQNDRIYDLLSEYNLSARIFSSSHDAWSEMIDYEECVAPVLKRNRQQSIDYLISSIES